MIEIFDLGGIKVTKEELRRMLLNPQNTEMRQTCNLKT